jgi:hypothetical protein
MFTGPHHYPPANFAAYGIVAFPSKATSATRDRYVGVCEAYVAALPRPSELAVPESDQMVTVWPVDSQDRAERLRAASNSPICGEAVDYYDLTTALNAIADAKLAGVTFGNEQGPFLLAWSPSSSKGQPHVPVLLADLSSAATPREVQLRFTRWRTDIEENPGLWRHGWDTDKLATTLREWADTVGPSILKLFE